MTGPQIIVLATPVFLAADRPRALRSASRAAATRYRLNDALSSIGLGVMSQIVGVFTALLTLGIYSAVHAHGALWQLPATSPWVWLGGLVAYDFLYYWHHRAGHRVALFWAAHVVHHQSEDYNLSTALRQTSSGWLVGWIFYLPMALAGFPPLVFGVVALIDLLYQFWVHTEQVGRLGWFDRWFCAPEQPPRPPRRQRRVPRPELRRRPDRLGPPVRHLRARSGADLPCVYGTRAPLRSWNPIRANLQVYVELARDSWRAQALGRQAARLGRGRPGGGRPTSRRGWPKPAFDLAAVERLTPPVPRLAAAVALLLFVALLAGTTALLWHAHTLSLAQQGLAALAIGVGLWLVGVATGSASARPTLRRCRRRRRGARQRGDAERGADDGGDGVFEVRFHGGSPVAFAPARPVRAGLGPVSARPRRRQ